MDEIFKRAALVLVWLGPHSEHCKTDIAIKRIQMGIFYLEYTRQGLTYDDTESVNALFELLARPYWKRMWVVQEFLLAKEVLICCGNDGFWWHDLFTTLWGLQNIWKVLRSDISMRTTSSPEMARKLVFQKYRAILGPEDGVISDSSGSVLQELVDLALEWRDQECQDPRDKIYALLGLAKRLSWGDDDTCLQANYDISLEHMFADLVQARTSRQLVQSSLASKTEMECRLIAKEVLGLDMEHHLVKRALDALSQHTLREIHLKGIRS